MYVLGQKFLKKAVFGTALTLFLGVTPMALAATVVVPSSMVPGRQAQPDLSSITPKSSVEALPPVVASPLAPEEAGASRFVLKHLFLDGVQALPRALFQPLWAPLIGKEISVSQLFDVAQKITELYAAQGYTLSFAMVPPQSIENGNARLKIVEGFVDQIEIDDGKTPLAPSLVARVRALLSPITASQPLKQSVLERYLLLLNDLPGIKASATFAPSTEKEGASLLHLVVVKKEADGEATLDNRMSYEMRRWRMGGRASYYQAWGGPQSFSASAHCGAQCRTYNDWGLKWERFVGLDGLKFSVDFSASTVRPTKGLLETLSFKGQDQAVVLGAAYPLLRSRQENVILSSDLSIRRSATKTFAGALTTDRVRTASVYASWDVADEWQALTLVRAGVSQGLGILSATTSVDETRSRFAGSSAFTNMTLRALRLQPLGVFSPDLSSWSLFVDTEAQAALTYPLLSASQCFYGGSSFGRGYDGGALSGDHCLMGVTELRYDARVNHLSVQPYGFVDAGAAWMKGELSSNQERYAGAWSSGFGVRVTPDVGASCEMQVAFPMRKLYAESVKPGPRVFFSLSVKL